ncbi:MAG: glycosyltransferase family 4 protein [Oscillospiraceae bacterium]|nr:glycosyltransferase family 4 protein [Oscillospiraceae bacterium]
MKIAFVSSYLSIHQLPFCLELYARLGDDFCFVATKSIPEERLANGYRDLNDDYSFVVRAYEDDEQRARALRLIEQADVVVHGSASWEYQSGRLKRKKPILLYSERLYKAGYRWWKWPIHLARFYAKYGRHKNLYLLCASAYTAGDFAKNGTFINKAYRWGYFPEVKTYEDVGTLLDRKQPATLLWVGRFLGWKHPEAAVEIARRLQAEGYDFRLKMIGSGELWDTIKRQVDTCGLQDRVELTGGVPADEVRVQMERTSLYLLTSDRNEGWGAVLNEAMNSACAVLASDAVGSAPFLLKDGENGLSYRSGDVDELYRKVKFLLDNPERGKKLGQNAYETMTGLWNAEVAAERLLELARALLRGETNPELYKEGPCSRAEIIW